MASTQQHPHRWQSTAYRQRKCIASQSESLAVLAQPPTRNPTRRGPHYNPCQPCEITPQHLPSLCFLVYNLTPYLTLIIVTPKVARCRFTVNIEIDSDQLRDWSGCDYTGRILVFVLYVIDFGLLTAGNRNMVFVLPAQTGVSLFADRVS